MEKKFNFSAYSLDAESAFNRGKTKNLLTFHSQLYPTPAPDI